MTRITSLTLWIKYILFAYYVKQSETISLSHESRRSGSFHPPPRSQGARPWLGSISFDVPDYNNFYRMNDGYPFYNSYSPRSISATTNSCFEPLSIGSCSGKFRRFHFDNNTNTCREFLYTGCGGNGNNYENGEHCKAICSAKSIVPIARVDPDIIKLSCTQPLEKGTCGAFFPRFYFNYQSKQCQEFIYTGCTGNENNFYTGDDCLKTCKANSIVKLSISSSSEPEAPKDPNRRKEICSMPVMRGTCSRLILRYYYNDKTSKCEEFIYSGCNGNQNNFIHGDHCAQFCNATGIHSLVNMQNNNGQNDWFNQGTLFPMLQPFDGYNVWNNMPNGRSVGPVHYAPRNTYFDDDPNIFNNNQRPPVYNYPRQFNYRPYPPVSTGYNSNAMTPGRNMASACYQPPDLSVCQFSSQQYIAYYYDANRRVCQQYVYRGCHQMNSMNNNNNNQDFNMGNIFSTSDIPNFNTDDFMKFAASTQHQLRNLFSSSNECISTCNAITTSYMSPSSTASLNSRMISSRKLPSG